MNNQNLGNVEYNESWDFYLCSVNDKLSSLFLNLGLFSIAPLMDKPNLYWISVKMKKPQEDGLSSNEESETLYDIEDYLDDKISTKYNGIYVGRLTSDGNRVFYFYLDAMANPDKITDKVRSSFVDYEFEYGISEDKKWEHYLDFLYPGAYHMQMIYNRKIVFNLHENGDDLTKPREVDHFFYFNSEANLEKFLEKIKNDNFTFVNKRKVDSDVENSYQLELKRVENVDLDSINDSTSYLFELAEELDGFYDGWGTTIQEDKKIIN